VHGLLGTRGKVTVETLPDIIREREAYMYLHLMSTP
jgi:hypothetical protein